MTCFFVPRDIPDYFLAHCLAYFPSFLWILPEPKQLSNRRRRPKDSSKQQQWVGGSAWRGWCLWRSWPTWATASGLWPSSTSRQNAPKIACPPVFLARAPQTNWGSSCWPLPRLSLWATPISTSWLTSICQKEDGAPKLTRKFRQGGFRETQSWVL